MTIDDILAELKDAGSQLDTAMQLDGSAAESKIAEQKAMDKADADAATALAAHQAANAKAAQIIADVQTYFRQAPVGAGAAPGAAAATS